MIITQARWIALFVVVSLASTKFLSAEGALRGPIVYRSGRDVVAIDGTGAKGRNVFSLPRALRQQDRWGIDSPDVSPDKRRVLISAAFPKTANAESENVLCVVDLDSRRSELLLAVETRAALVAIHSPRWAPDGHRIAFVWRHPGLWPSRRQPAFYAGAGTGAYSHGFGPSNDRRRLPTPRVKELEPVLLIFDCTSKLVEEYSFGQIRTETGEAVSSLVTRRSSVLEPCIAWDAKGSSILMQLAGLVFVVDLSDRSAIKLPIRGDRVDWSWQTDRLAILVSGDNPPPPHVDHDPGRDPTRDYVDVRSRAGAPLGRWSVGEEYHHADLRWIDTEEIAYTCSIGRTFLRLIRKVEDVVRVLNVRTGKKWTISRV